MGMGPCSMVTTGEAPAGRAVWMAWGWSLEKVGKQTLTPSLSDAHAALEQLPESGGAGVRVGGSRGAPVLLGSESGWAAVERMA